MSISIAALVLALPPQEPTFERVQLDATFYSEGASFADLDGDGHGDVVSGPFWYAGPDFEQRFEVYAPRPFDPVGYSDNFFAFPRDFDGDGALDVLVVGFPGQDARIYFNPGSSIRSDAHWRVAVVFDLVDNESPTFTDLTGDGAPELVFHTAGRLGWAGPGDDPSAKWAFHPLSEDLGLQRFTHGLGVGDVDGDGRADVLLKTGWWRQPASLEGDPVWRHFPFPFAQKGGAQMHAVDVDGDGDNDVITSLAAHDFGLAWFENTGRNEDGGVAFARHLLLGEERAHVIDGVQFAELHAVDLADVNGDGLLDIVTGKRWWSHGAKGDPELGNPPVVYWFELVRGEDGARFVPHLIDDDSGVGTQVVAGDVNGDGRIDVVVGNKKGTFAILQNAPGEPSTQREIPRVALADTPDGPEGIRPLGDDGEPLNLDFETGDLSDWTADADDWSAWKGQPIRGDVVTARGREASRHQGEYWLGGYEVVEDAGKGRLRSAPFAITHPWGAFLVGGGDHDGTVVELREEGSDALLFRSTGANYESMQRVVVDLAKHRGKRARIVVVDEKDGGWGHVNYDDFRFYDEKPEFVRPADVPEIRPKDVVEHAGLTPEEAVRAMDLPDGFRVDLVASEPDMHQPVAFTIDAKNRLWVAEAFSYPKRAPEGEGRDSLLVFSDEDGDGSFETRTVFANDLNLVSGFEVGFGGVWVGAAPYLLFLPDADDDLVPDGPAEIVLDGWGYQDTHETLNAFVWGPDGWLYGCHGVFTHSNVGAPGATDDERTRINAGVWRFHPIKREFEVFAEGSSNPWGVTFDAHGEAFITACVIPHLYHLSQGGRYLRQAGSHFNRFVYDDIGTIADHRHYIGTTPHSGNNRSNAAGGGHAHCGALIYLGDSFPDEYRGALFMNNIHGNRVNMDRLTPDGSGFVGSHGPDFLMSNDTWWRGIALKTGPDGSVYVSDWYDEQACHLTLPEVWDRTNGRLYRVSYEGYEHVATDLRARTSVELAALQATGNDWFARNARVVLQERGPDAAVHALLDDQLASAADDERALRALWSLHVTGGLIESRSLAALSDPREYVRAWAVQLACEDLAPSDAEHARMVAMCADDPSPVVRRYLASALQRVAPERAWPMVERLALHAEDADDANLPKLIWYGLEPLVVGDPERALALARRTPIDLLGRFVVRRAASDRGCIDTLVADVNDEPDATRRAWMLDELSVALEGELGLAEPAGWSELYARVAQEGDAGLREKGLWLAAAFGDRDAFPALLAVVKDGTADTGRRRRALDALVRARDTGATETLHELAAQAGPLQRDAIRALAGLGDDRTPSLLVELAASEDVNREARQDALGTLASRAPWAETLLEAVLYGRIDKNDVGAYTLRTLDTHDDAAIDELMGKLWVRRPTPEAAAARMAELRALLTPETLAQADLAHGRQLFANTCMRCHTLFGVGGTLAPELTGSNRADLEYLLSNVVDPNAVIGKDYQVTVAWLKNGRIVTGIEKARTDTAVTLQSDTASVVVAFDEIDELQLSELSTMPEGLLDPFTDDELRDLVAYLQSPTQVALALSPDDTSAFFDGVSLAGWTGDLSVWSVQNGEIVGKTDGLAHNTWLRSDFVLGDFRLALDVRLAKDEGNSGIQFRSAADEAGEVSGYQADIGPGWWGKLYEEHGRAVLWDQSGEEHVEKDGWNHYVIEAIGHRVRTWINGQPCVDLEDPDGALEGIVALQVHSGGATEVRFRNLELVLDPEPLAK